MISPNSTANRSELLRKISLLEWDIEHIDNESIKSRKIDFLKEYKLQLKRLNKEGIQ